MNWIKRLLYGFLIGIASIAPGISGGTIAIALGFYENLINAVANILKSFREHFSYLFPFGVGAVMSIATLSVAFDYMFERFPFPTNMLFIGFILGTLPFIKGRFKNSLSGSSISWKHILTGAVFLSIVLLPLFISTQEVSSESSDSTGSMLMFFMIGIIIAATLVIPGLSGTMILTALGFYKPLLHTASSFVTSVITLNFAETTALLVSVIPLGIGVLLGGILIAKLLNMLFKVIPSYIYAAVIGLICATPVVMLFGVQFSGISAGAFAVGIAALAGGLFLGCKLGEQED